MLLSKANSKSESKIHLSHSSSSLSSLSTLQSKSLFQLDLSHQHPKWPGISYLKSIIKLIGPIFHISPSRQKFPSLTYVFYLHFLFTIPFSSTHHKSPFNVPGIPLSSNQYITHLHTHFSVFLFVVTVALGR